MSSLRSRRRVVVVAVAAAAALPAVALAADGSPLPGWMEHMIGQAPPAMQQMMRSPEMQQMMGGR